MHGLEPIIGSEVLKGNPQTFEKACVLDEQILWIVNLFGGGGTHSEWSEHLDYAPMELDSIGTR